jgi:HSP20 family molecular chaperone IbpA
MIANCATRDVFGQFPLVSDLEVTQQPDRVTVHMALAGVKPEAVSVTAIDNLLTIKGERTLERSQRVYRFTRTTPLPRGVRATNVITAFHDGVLEVIVPLAAGPALGDRLA